MSVHVTLSALSAAMCGCEVWLKVKCLVVHIYNKVVYVYVSVVGGYITVILSKYQEDKSCPTFENYFIFCILGLNRVPDGHTVR